MSSSFSIAVGHPFDCLLRLSIYPFAVPAWETYDHLQFLHRYLLRRSLRRVAHGAYPRLCRRFRRLQPSSARYLNARIPRPPVRRSLPGSTRLVSLALAASLLSSDRGRSYPLPAGTSESHPSPRSRPRRPRRRRLLPLPPHSPLHCRRRHHPCRRLSRPHRLQVRLERRRRRSRAG